MSQEASNSENFASSRIAVMGAGAVGCYYGGLLARAGHEVTLIARPDHVRAVERDGLRIQTSAFDEHVRVRAHTDAGAIASATVVLFCVKSTDTESAAAQMLPYLASDAIVLTLQNGVDNAQRLRESLPVPVAATVVYVGAEMAGAGHVLHHGRGELVLERMAQSQALARMMIDAGIPTEISDNVQGALWSKLVLNCAYNAISAIAQMPYGQIALDDGAKRVMRDVVAECVAVAKAEGVNLSADVGAAVANLPRAMPGQYSSTAQDLARGRRSEIDHLNGHVMRRGDALGVATPVNGALHALVKLLEAKGLGGRA